ncbi:MAG: SDR family oxidoreductase [Saccharospirillaceae bacterium]|nr:SDR family oxidoreductase [Pseudomonadales bacterium]NRB80916.1 SDR family oxidoreductase [Saccharospirillaceae bacterium]
MKNTILVIGGTGQVGTALVDLLKTNNSDFKLLLRNTDKQAAFKSREIDSVVGALGDWPSIDNALKGISTVFLLTSNDPQMFEKHKQLIDRAVSAGVKKIVRLSAQPADANCDMDMYRLHGEADNYLQQTNIEHVILRPTYFLQNISVMHAYFIKTNNAFAQYLGDTRIPMIDIRDIANAAYQSLTSDQFNNGIYYLTGPKAVNYTEFAQTLSDTLGRTISYQPLSYDEQLTGLKAAGLPDWVLDTVMKLFKQWVENDDHTVSGDLEILTNNKGISIQQFCEDYATEF